MVKESKQKLTLESLSDPELQAKILDEKTESPKEKPAPKKKKTEPRAPKNISVAQNKTILNVVEKDVLKTPQPKKNHEVSPISEEDLRLQKEIYAKIKFWEEALTREYKDEKRNTINKQEYQELQSSPCKWLLDKSKATIMKLKAQLENPDNKDNIERINRDISLERGNLENLKEAYKRNIPLAIKRESTPLSIKLDRGGTFDVTQYAKALNQYFGKEATYTIEGLIQRRNERFLVLKTSEGETVELPAKEGDKMLEKRAKDIENQVKYIKTGDEIEVSQKGKTALYTIVLRGRDKITYRTENGAGGEMTLNGFREFLTTLDGSFKNLSVEKDKREIEIKQSVENLKKGDKIEYQTNGVPTTLTISDVVGNTITTYENEGDELTPSIADLKAFLLSDQEIVSSIRFIKVEESKDSAENSEKKTVPIDSTPQTEEQLEAQKKEAEITKIREKYAVYYAEIKRQREEILSQKTEPGGNVDLYEGIEEGDVNRDLIDLLGHDTLAASVDGMKAFLEKEADIEKRRHEELMKNKYYKLLYEMGDDSDEYGPAFKELRNTHFIPHLKSSIEEDTITVDEKKDTDLEEYYLGKIKGSQEAIDYINKVNAIYDTELATLKKEAGIPEKPPARDQEVIDSLTEKDYIEVKKSVLTPFGIERAQGEDRLEKIDEVKKMAQVSFDYLDGKITARQYLQTPPYNYTDAYINGATEDSLLQTAQKESEYFKNLRKTKESK